MTWNTTTQVTTEAVTNDDATGWPALALRDEALVSVEIGIQIVIFLLAVGGNGLVLGMLVAMSRRKDLGRMYTMIGHLSCADLFVAIFNLLPQLLWDVTHRFHGGRLVCKLVKYWQVLVLYASSYVLVSTALDRYVAICHPMRSHPWTSASAHRLVAVAWLTAVIFAVPQLIIFDFVELEPAGSGVYDCWGHFQPEWTLPLYITWFAAAVYVVPLLLLAAIYIRICSVVWRSAATAPPLPTFPSAAGVSVHTASAVVVSQSTPRGKRSRSATASLSRNDCLSDRFSATTIPDSELAAVHSMSKAKTKTVKLTLTVVASYVVCWGPFITAQLWSAWDPHAPFEGKAMVITLLLASLNSCTNPWIYMAFSDHLRRRLVRCCHARLQFGSQTAVNSSSGMSCRSSEPPLPPSTTRSKRTIL